MRVRELNSRAKILHIPKVIESSNNFAYIGCKQGELLIYDYQEHLILDYILKISDEIQSI